MRRLQVGEEEDFERRGREGRGGRARIQKKTNRKKRRGIRNLGTVTRRDRDRYKGRKRNDKRRRGRDRYTRYKDKE